MCTHSRNVCESEFFHGTYGGLLLVVSELDSKLRGLGQRPGLVNVLCSLAKVFSLRVTLTIQENKWVLANFQESIMKCRGLTLWWIGIPSKGGTVILLVTSRNQEKLWGHLVWVQTSNFFFTWIWDITFQEIQFSWPPIVARVPHWFLNYVYSFLYRIMAPLGVIYGHHQLFGPSLWHTFVTIGVFILFLPACPLTLKKFLIFQFLR